MKVIPSPGSDYCLGPPWHKELLPRAQSWSPHSFPALMVRNYESKSSFLLKLFLSEAVTVKLKEIMWKVDQKGRAFV